MTASWLAGRGRADITGEPAQCGMLGYGMAWQQSAGIHLRLRARAFVLADAASGKRILLVVNDLPLVFDSIREALLSRLGAQFGDLYTAENTMVTATHTHCGPGGYSHHALYNSNTRGFRPSTYAAIVDGMTEAVEQAHADLAPASLALSHGELRDASVNRSRSAFDRNTESERAFFPDAVDPQTSLLRIDRDGRAVGAINWFATHNTSMTNQNRLISSDNKGYAGYHWEKVVEDVDYHADDPGFVSAFAQTNAGDMSPNLELKPGIGPTDDEVENTRLIGLRQYEAAAKLFAGESEALEGGLDYRLVNVDLSAIAVRPEFTGDGRPHRTGTPMAGASALAGAWSDGPAFPTFREGRNPVWDWLSRNVFYRLSPAMADAHAPKGLVLPAHLLNRLKPMVAERFPVQLLRIGQLYLIGIPGEATITAGLRLRRTVAAIVGANLADVLVAGYSNGYAHYVTTPEEYEAQQYEGGSTLFGKWELPALQQVVDGLASAMRDGVDIERGNGIEDLSAKQRPQYRLKGDEPVAGYDFGDVIVQPSARRRPGDVVAATFAGAHPNNDLRRGGTYFEVEIEDGDGWRGVADDGDWATTFRWSRVGDAGSTVTITWHIPEDVEAGVYRIRYTGDAQVDGDLRPFTGTTHTFTVI
ncbi:MAG: ceramidase [Amycolatopsis sp.]|uniref:neutral/alkaline ceramidase n=1 Tax=Amycolatopsis sp. TaxID=37632 RepID=UPI0026093BB4|nr:neutral/alkaline ceramidase [Amycolatopsis sp.]MCU1687199.1 ceramidase [Amycolatopsis sp.]